MWLGVVSLFPEMFTAITDYGITRRAVERQQVTLNYWNPRDYTHDRHRTVDDRPYGGGPGMVMMAEPLLAALEAAKQAAPQGSKTLYMSPQGRVLDQASLQQLAQAPGLILLAGRYEGVDERVLEDAVDEEYSIGDYVLSGGELAAMVLIDGITRLRPGVLGDPASVEQDSFMAGLLDHPHYTRPEQIAGRPVPKVLLSGDHAAIDRWRLQQALGRTWQRRPDLLQDYPLDSEQQTLLDEYIRQRQRGRRADCGD